MSEVSPKKQSSKSDHKHDAKHSHQHQVSHKPSHAENVRRVANVHGKEKQVTKKKHHSDRKREARRLAHLVKEIEGLHLLCVFFWCDRLFIRLLVSLCSAEKAGVCWAGLCDKEQAGSQRRWGLVFKEACQASDS